MLKYLRLVICPVGQVVSLFQKLRQARFVGVWICCLASIRGAYRDRHGRGKRDAMDVKARQASVAGTDG
jgi:hypothetical protein